MPKSFTLLHSPSPRIPSAPRVSMLVSPGSALRVHITKPADVPSSDASALWPLVDDGLGGGRIVDNTGNFQFL